MCDCICVHVIISPRTVFVARNCSAGLRKKLCVIDLCWFVLCSLLVVVRGQEHDASDYCIPSACSTFYLSAIYRLSVAQKLARAVPMSGGEGEDRSMQRAADAAGVEWEAGAEQG